MPDYGHDLRFGTFLTPDASDPQGVLALAVATEEAGLDLVTVQDHPYQARFLDVFALLATVLARTSTVMVAPNVANLPLRPPFVLAKTVASLDLLGQGRVELGIGAGGFWDAIAAAGGPRRSPGEAVAALEEAIAVIRGTWDTAQRSLRVPGEHYRVRGVHPGPAPAHPVEVWVGALGPRMLELTGRLGDGWLPSMSYVPPESLAERNARIDDAAHAAGRRPADVRRLYNVNEASGSGPGLVGAPEDWAEQLAALALEQGMSTFLLASDDPGRIRRFGEEVAPAVRALVAAARGVPTGAAAPGATRTRPWDDTTRPTHDVDEPVGGWTPAQHATAQHLVDVHDHLRSELEQLVSLVDQVENGSLEVGRARSLVNELTLRQNNWTLGAYCESYCRVVTIHHTLEDTSMFPHLRAREPGLGPVIDRLEEEHHGIAGVLEEVDRALVALVSRPDGIVDLRRAVDLLDETLRSHLAWEEQVLRGPLARHGLG